MSDKSKIEWTDATWNPVTGCSKVSEGCRNCYAMKFAERWRGTPGHYFENGFDVQLRPDKLDEPLKWKRPRRIFVNSMSDLFHEQVPDEFIRSVFLIIQQCPQHTFQILTKRPERMKQLLNRYDWNLTNRYSWEKPLSNVWLGVSVENQKAADERIPLLLETRAAVRFLSCEPLLGPVDLVHVNLPRDLQPGWSMTEDSLKFNCLADDDDRLYDSNEHIDWVIAGGESGPGARPVNPEWIRSLRDQCEAAEVPFFFKQWGEWVPNPEVIPTPKNIDRIGWWIPEGFAPHQVGAAYNGEEYFERVGKKAAGRLLDGRTWDDLPEVAQ